MYLEKMLFKIINYYKKDYNKQINIIKKLNKYSKISFKID